MLSRVANSLFWLARYLERADKSARFLAVTHGYAQEMRAVSHVAADQCWGVARKLLTGESDGEESRAQTFWKLAYDEVQPTSLLASIASARENARGIRDAIPSEMWEELNVLYLRLRDEVGQRPSETGQIALLHRVRSVSLQVLALRDNTMVRSDEWHFLRLGQYTESADMSTRMIGAMYAHPAVQEAKDAGHSIDTLHLTALLRMFSALEGFSRAEPLATAESVAEFLLLDARFPGSVEFAVQEIGYSLHGLSGTALDIFSSDAEQICGRLVSDLRFASIEEVLRDGFAGYLAGVSSKLASLNHAISDLYFR
jgi:uncharacterized alpha-E superfamily protein